MLINQLKHTKQVLCDKIVKIRSLHQLGVCPILLFLEVPRFEGMDPYVCVYIYIHKKKLNITILKHLFIPQINLDFSSSTYRIKLNEIRTKFQAKLYQPNNLSGISQLKLAIYMIDREIKNVEMCSIYIVTVLYI